jgi:hypothetical protein
MPKDSIHYNGWEHRDVHNINGVLFVSDLLNLDVHVSIFNDPRSDQSHLASCL